MKTDFKTEEQLLNIVQCGYQEIADDFDITRKKKIWPEVYQLAEDVKEGDKILDVGCGNGRLLDVLQKKNIRYLGVDNSENLLEIARRNYPGQEFVIADILDLDVVDNDFYDHVFCLAVVHHIPTKERQIEALRQLSVKLSPNGRIILSVWNLWSKAKYRRLLFNNFCLKIIGKYRMSWKDLVFPWKNSRGEDRGLRYYHAFLDGELRKVVKAAGLRVAWASKNNYNYWYILEK
ncbi:MAG: methyltransferase domain-containing protein [Patescibacteria group bacterium]|jgi:2-polyprenyl-3-methyl-5-hydroxy-6-metoxy-1,4-benzoquinol methylase